MPLETISLEYTAAGYLVIPAVVARALFPHDALVVLARDGMLWLLPTRGPGGGGLLLKQRNVHGDRSVLLTEALREAGFDHVPPGRWTGSWSVRDGALHVALPAPSDVRAFADA